MQINILLCSVVGGILFLSDSNIANALKPAAVSCDASYSAPCARTNSQWLAVSTKQALYDMPTTFRSFAHNLNELFSEIQNKRRNMDTGFYPFVVRRDDAVCVAHGAQPAFAGLTLQQIFDRTGIRFSDVDALHERFQVAAFDRGGDWVRYLWSDPNNDQDANNIVIESKKAFVTNLTANYYLGVGYENQQLPVDIPCSAQLDSWCSITNVRSLVGAAQFHLEEATSLENFEAAVHDISFEAEVFSIEQGFYPFLYHYDGRLKAHAILHDSFGLNLSTIFEQKELGTRVEGMALHDRFVATAEAQQQGSGSGWIQYPWRNSLDEEAYTKIAYITKIEFEGDPYYLGVGYGFVMGDAAVDDGVCSFEYNLPCAFKTTLQLSSHSLSYAISSPSTNVNENFATLSNEFRRDDFYVFVYDYNNTCVTHGLVPSYVGLSLNEVFHLNDIPLDANQLHSQFRTAASQGGGWVSYDWLIPGVENSEFEKLSYMFQFNIDGRDYYAGVGFNHKRAPVEYDADYGSQKNGQPIPCSRYYGLDCSENNVRAILGQALADLTLATSPVANTNKGDWTLDDVLDLINQRDEAYRVNNFHVSVFSQQGEECSEPDGSGCCVADGNDFSLVGRTWQQILDNEKISSIRGVDLHERLMAQSNTGGGSIEYPWSRDTGEAQTKRSWVARFRQDGETHYVIAEYLMTSQPPSCDDCPSGMECTDSNQFFCQDKPDTPEPAFVAMIVLLSVGVPCLFCCFWIQKRRSKARSRAKIQAVEDKLKDMTVKLDQSMQGMVTVVHDMPIQLPEKYMQKVENRELAAASAKADSAIIWYWEEDASLIDRHKSSAVLSSTNFVMYSREVSSQMEHAFQRFAEGKGFCKWDVDLSDTITKTHNASTGAYYEMDFEKMVQKNLTSNYKRAIRREEVEFVVDSDVANLLPKLPDDIDFSDEAEDLLPTFKGQVIQVSKAHPNKKWLFGNVLYDPLLTEALKQPQATTPDGLSSMLANTLHDRPTSGWFPKSVTQPADLRVMRKLLDTLGGEGAEALKPPDTWDEAKEGRMIVQKGTKEYQKVSDYFNAALHGQRDYVTIKDIERIQNMPLWQSYSVKKQTMRTRDQNHPEHRINNRDLDSVERRWLFHGTTKDVIPKIEKQGFNRAFAGRHAVAFGKGVYFARDASYSSHKAYSEPDSKGIQRMFLCRVAVGDWCQGTTGQLTPNPKPHNNLELFDSTVDNEKNPSIFVVYHDSQAYPDYLVSFLRQ